MHRLEEGMRIKGYRLCPKQRLFVKCVLIILIVEGVFWGEISCGKGLQQVFWLHWQRMINAGQPVQDVPFAALINQYGKEYGVDPALIAAVIRCESSFNPRAVSKAGAVGLMQICLPTWREIKKNQPQWANIAGQDNDLQVLYRPEINIAAGTLYLRSMLTRYGGDPVRAVAAYNAGPGSVDRCEGIPPYRETIRYVHHVAATWQEYRGIADASTICYRWGFFLEQSGRKMRTYFHGGIGGICCFICLWHWRQRQIRRW